MLAFFAHARPLLVFVSQLLMLNTLDQCSSPLPLTFLCVRYILFCVCPGKIHYCLIAYNLQKRNCVIDLILFLIFLFNMMFKTFVIFSVQPNLLHIVIAQCIQHIWATTFLEEIQAASDSWPPYVMLQWTSSDLVP